MTASIKAVSAQTLVREEHYTDNAAGEIIRQIPVLKDGSQDPVRQEIWIGACVLTMSNGAQMPLRFPIDADSLEQAILEWPHACNEKIEELQGNAIRSRIVNGAGIALGDAKKGRN